MELYADISSKAEDKFWALCDGEDGRPENYYLHGDDYLSFFEAGPNFYISFSETWGVVSGKVLDGLDVLNTLEGVTKIHQYDQGNENIASEPIINVNCGQLNDQCLNYQKIKNYGPKYHNMIKGSKIPHRYVYRSPGKGRDEKFSFFYNLEYDNSSSRMLDLLNELPSYAFLAFIFGRVCIYSFNNDSWNVRREDINTLNDDKFGILPYPKARLVNGAAYFVQGRQVVKFDISRPMLRKINLPVGRNYITDHHIMEEYGESIAIIGSAYPLGLDSIDIDRWVVMMVLIHDDNSYFWETKFIIKAGDNIQFQAMSGFMNSNELVIRKRHQHREYFLYRDDHREYFLYNVENGFQQQFRLTPEAQAHEKYLRRINITTESLLLLSETTMPPTLWEWR
ncbi:hypothetical protein POM88_047564 [Heracleum sosnowskyi]|uniref:Uncharacterized protein n=1 Tax=Heracleum sosnowskyi TaxID=360622 RepID=A0AAD8GTP7_9APIA|nr:hypothetical protein POM88_047564 [Heracleum sosnowskyi]